ncbi:MAG: stage II sporulation protein D [Bacillota bacterium]|nr:stage II sporulation protein D [Bacillota bacterium]
MRNMMRIIFAVKINKGKYIIAAILIFILLFPVSVSILSKSDKKSSSLKEIGEFNLNESSIKFNDIGIKVDKVKVFISSENKIVEMNLEDYLPGVVSGEMPAGFEIEALKAQAVAARTFALAHVKSLGGAGCSKAPGADICDTVHCQVYESKEQKFMEWNESQRQELWDKVVSAVKATEGQVLTYNGELVMSPQYFSASSGKTEDAAAVFGSSSPYLKSVDSPGEEIAGEDYKKVYQYKYKDLADLINKAFPNAKVSDASLHKQIEILSASEAGTVTKLKVGSITVTGSQFRFGLNLHSANFTFNFKKDVVEIQCLGYGHQVGMSQWGADVMAKNGSNYVQILTHYYQGTKVQKTQ